MLFHYLSSVVLISALYGAAADKKLLQERERLEKQYKAHNERYNAGQEKYTVGFNDLTFLSDVEYRNLPGLLQNHR